jgi:hypothetical protein
MFCKLGHQWDYYSNIIPISFRRKAVPYYRFLLKYVWYSGGGSFNNRYGYNRRKKFPHSAYYKAKDKKWDEWTECCMSSLLDNDIDEKCPKVHHKWAPSWHSLEKIQKRHKVNYKE